MLGVAGRAMTSMERLGAQTAVDPVAAFVNAVARCLVVVGGQQGVAAGAA